MREQIDKLIFDSRWNESTGEAPDAICSVVAESFLREGVLVSDLAWKRGLALRRITASLFEGEAASEKLDRIESIEIVSESESEAHLYGLWLASRLGWSWRGRFAKNGRTTWRAADPGGREILIHSELCEGAGSGEVDVDLSVQIDLIGGEAIFVNGTPGGCADTIMPGKEGERHLFLSPSTGQMLQEEVDSLRSDYLYAEALALCSPGASGLAAHDSGDSE
jgi:glucose-6-phosphate dehydrogenase assembly protein OpcA